MASSGEAPSGTGDASPDTSGTATRCAGSLRVAHAGGGGHLDSHPSAELRAPQPHAQGPPPPLPPPPPPPSRRRARCRFFGQPSGCRSGAACPFRHELGDGDASQPSSAAVNRAAGVPAAPSPGSTAAASNTSRITHRPVPQSQLANPRAYQVEQLRRRFSPVDERSEASATILTFRLPPSDPDFPYELDALHCSLRVPLHYPDRDKPTLRVTNPEMERGYQINVERGFDRIVAASKSVNLLACLNALDKQLEALLSSEKAVTVRLVQNQSRPAASEPAAAPVAVTPEQPQPASRPARAHVSAPDAGARERARGVRAAEVRQLEARLGKLPQFQKSADGLTFTVPVDIRKRQALPVELQAVKLVKLIVPDDYNLSPCRLHVVGASDTAADAVAASFEKRAASMPQLSLFNHINYLSQNMHLMAKEDAKTTGSATNLVLSPELAHPPRPSEPDSSTAPSRSESTELFDRSHLVVIPRPPEFDVGKEEEANDSDSSSESDDEMSAGGESDAETEPQASAAVETRGPERGVLISFPHLELHGIEVLELLTLSVTVKCDRCKDSKDIKNIYDSIPDSQTRTETCKKCAAPFAIGFRKELMHVNSTRAGYIDLNGCTIADMLTSNFIPTCAECSTTYPQPGVAAVRGDVSIAFCRSCHRKMTFRLPEIKFLRTGASGLALKATAGQKKKISENLGIVVGHELPNRGRCGHYKKSYRWFRFSCCEKVFPCDRCHDEAVDHAIEHANRMICGFCSREQNYRPKDCGTCHAFLTVRPGKGFWEGGSGTRDRVKMSRKDPRKYKRTRGSKPAAT